MKSSYWIIGTLLLLGGLFWWWKASQLPIPENEKNKPVDQIMATDWTLGNPNAPIRIVEYSDFECPACKFFADFGHQVTAKFGDKVGFAYRHFPLREIHKNTNLAAQAAEAAGKQGKFWEMSQLLFTHQEEWGNSNQPLILLGEYAKQLGLNLNQFTREIDSASVKALVEADYLSGMVARIDATPTFFVNGQRMNNLKNPEDLMNRIELALQQATESGTPKP